MVENNKVNSLFQSAKARVVMAVVAFVVIVAVVIGVWHHEVTVSALKGVASVSEGPGIDSVPGAGNSSNAYVAAQNVQNALQAQEARTNATSFVPTITRQGFVGSPDAFTESSPTESHSSKLQCPIKKVVYMYKPNPASCSLENLQLARKAGVTAEELLCQSCSCPALRVAGYTAGELKDTGYTAADLRHCGYALTDLKAAGFSAADLKDAGFSATELKAMGFSAGELASAGFTPNQLQAAGFTAAQLQAAGVSLTTTDCNIDALKKARVNGASASALRKGGCGVAALKAAGFTAAELKNAGFSAQDLKDAGFSANDLKAAGFSAAELKNAGFSNAALQAAGFSPSEIRAAQVLSTSCNMDALKKARMSGISATELKEKGCGLAALKAAGFTAAELRNAGFSASDLKAAGFKAQDLKAAGFSAADLKAAGFTAAALKAAGFTANDLQAAGFSAAALKSAGFTAAELRNAGFSAADLKAAGFSAADLKKAGFSAAALKAVGFSAGDLKNAGFSAADLKAAGFSAQQMRAAGFSAADLKDAGFSANQLRNAGYTKGDLLRAGYSPEAAGYNLSPPTDNNTPQPPPMSSTNPVNPGPSQAGASMPTMGSGDAAADRLRQIQQMQQEQLNQQERRDVMQQMQGQMSMQAQKLMAEWSNNSQQTMQTAIEQPVQNGGTGAGDGGAGSGKNIATGPVIKAGSIIFAVLDTGLNSDEKSPILATIVTGDLKGAKLIGDFDRIDKKVLIRFNLINVPSFDHTFGINAVAIDPNTARTALAGSVNNHYLLRYGTLFASSFLSGLAQGIIQSGATQDCFLGFCHSTYQKLNTGQYAALGLGNVGQQYATVMGQNFNTPPTIKVAGGTGIGILFMSDVTLPQSLPSEKN